MDYKIAIISTNTLSSIALKSMLEDVAHGIEICIFYSFEDLQKRMNETFVHFFVDAKNVFDHLSFFTAIQRKIIVLCEGENSLLRDSGFKLLDVSAPETELVKFFLGIHNMGHPQGQHPGLEDEVVIKNSLSVREIEVLRLVVKGSLSKEIADELHISQATVAFHRNNISDKLGTRSVGRLAIYAVMNGIVKAEDL